MRASFTGAVLILALTLALCWCSLAYIRSVCDSELEILEEVRLSAVSGDWESAGTKSAGALAEWEENHGGMGLLLHHSEVEEVFAGLAAMKEFADTRELGELLAKNAELSRLVESIRQSEEAVYWNVF